MAADTMTATDAPGVMSMTELAAAALTAKRDADARRDAETEAAQQRWHVEASTRLAAVAHELLLDTLGEVDGADRLTWTPVSPTLAETTLDGYRVQVRAESNIPEPHYVSLWLRLPCEAGHTDDDLYEVDGRLPWHRIDPSHLLPGRKHEARSDTLVKLGTLLDDHAAGRLGCSACWWERVCARCAEADRAPGSDRCQGCLDAEARDHAPEAEAGQDRDAAAAPRPPLPTLAERLDGAEIGYPDETAALAIQHARHARKVQGTDREPDGEALIAAINGVTLALLSISARLDRGEGGAG